MGTTSEDHNLVREFLKRVTSFSILDSGEQLSARGAVLESNKIGKRIQGIVRDEDITTTTTLDVLSLKEIDAACSCCSDEEMQEFWCKHAVAVFFTASRLGFLDDESGFKQGDSVIRINISGPEEIAEVMRDLTHMEYAAHTLGDYRPDVSVRIVSEHGRLGVQILFDGEIQLPASTHEQGRPRSKRALDTIVLRVLDDEGVWDEDRQCWFVSSSKSIEIVLGLLQEYEKVQSFESRASVEFPIELLEAKLVIIWHTTQAEFGMKWVLPDGSEQQKHEGLVGNNPHWVMLGKKIYRLSSTASRVCSIFPFDKTITIPKSQTGPILEQLGRDLFQSQWVEVVNPKLQPSCEVKEPTPTLVIGLRDTKSEHFVSSERLELEAALEFGYPIPPKDENVVYLPDHTIEQDYRDFLSSIGFIQQGESKILTISGDEALDVVYDGPTIFKKPWKVTGLEVLKERVRFVDISVNVSLKSSSKPRSGQSKSAQWFDCEICLQHNKSQIPINILFKPSRVASERWIKLETGEYARVPGGSLGYLKTTFGMVDPNFRLSTNIKAKLGTAQALNLGRIDDKSFKIQLDTKLQQLQEKLLNFKEVSTVTPSAAFEGVLRSYQEEGLQWINFLDDFELGGILADEMGLGKTVQALAFLQLLKEKRKAGKKAKPVLIVAPTSVVTNWCYEIKRFAPNLSVLLLQGPQRKLFFKDIPKYDIVVTSYALLRLDRPEFEKFEFEYFILDEAQNIKNPNAAITKAAKAIKARGRIALTGTPVENRPVELWSIIDFVMPGYLGSEDFFRNYIERPIIEGNTTPQILKFLHNKTKPFLLRRTKAEVEKDLPPKIESVMHVDMSSSQMQLYGQVLEEVRPKVLDAVQKKGVAGASVSILAALLRLRQICNHPNSIEALKEIPGFDSGKFNLLKELVEDAVQSGRKILVFSQFREMLSIIRRWLTQAKIEHLYLDGGTKNRQALIDQFNSDESVRLFLISLKAGGTGLNLTAADTVIIYDPWWNPAVESQAVDRAHRIGQTKAVSVYRLVTENSVEQKIMDLKAQKSKIVDALISDQGLSTLKLSKADIESLFEAFPGKV